MISSISPAVADRGEVVTITGQGLGGTTPDSDGRRRAGHARVGDGERATFRVPALRAGGRGRGRRAQAGRHGGADRADGPLRREHGRDRATRRAAVSAPIGERGRHDRGRRDDARDPGRRRSGRDDDHGDAAALAPGLAVRGGAGRGEAGAVRARAAAAGDADAAPPERARATLVGFGFNGNGEGFHLVPHRAVGETVQLKVWHFSGAGVLTARLDELAAALSYEPTPAHELAEQRIAAALVDAAGQRQRSRPGDRRRAPRLAVELGQPRAADRRARRRGSTSSSSPSANGSPGSPTCRSTATRSRPPTRASSTPPSRSTATPPPTPPPQSPAASSSAASAPTSPAPPSAT